MTFNENVNYSTLTKSQDFNFQTIFVSLKLCFPIFKDKTLTNLLKMDDDVTFYDNRNTSMPFIQFDEVTGLPFPIYLSFFWKLLISCSLLPALFFDLIAFVGSGAYATNFSTKKKFVES